MLKPDRVKFVGVTGDSGRIWLRFADDGGEKVAELRYSGDIGSEDMARLVAAEFLFTFDFGNSLRLPLWLEIYYVLLDAKGKGVGTA